MPNISAIAITTPIAPVVPVFMAPDTEALVVLAGVADVGVIVVVTGTDTVDMDMLLVGIDVEVPGANRNDADADSGIYAGRGDGAVASRC